MGGEKRRKIERRLMRRWKKNVGLSGKSGRSLKKVNEGIKGVYGIGCRKVLEGGKKEDDRMEGAEKSEAMLEDGR